MLDIAFMRGEITRLRLQVLLQRRDIARLQRAGIPSTSAEALLDRMLNKIDDLCAQRDRLKQEQAKALWQRSANRTLMAARWHRYPRAIRVIRRPQSHTQSLMRPAFVT